MTEDNHEIDVARLRELMAEYQSVRTPARRREIENTVLEETLWSAPEVAAETVDADEDDDLLQISRAELDALGEYVPEDDKEGKQLLRSPYVRKL